MPSSSLDASLSRADGYAQPQISDEQEYRSGAVYLGNRSEGEHGASDPIFEYLLSVVMRDGAVHQAPKWIPSQSLRVLIGSSQIKAELGFVPGKEQPKP